MSRRLVRVAELLRSELGRLIARERSLEGMLITITGVDVTPDLKQAFVYISTLNAEVPQETILSALNAQRKEWQKDIGRAMHTKFTPRFAFRYDNAQERGDQLMDIMNKLDIPEEDKG